jgi:hypothetical protein
MNAEELAFKLDIEVSAQRDDAAGRLRDAPGEFVELTC